jgi:hypothetical protein
MTGTQVIGRATPLRPGTTAPDFELRSTPSQTVKLSGFRGRPVIHVHADRVHEDVMSGVRSGVNVTPTFFINGLRYDDSYGSDTLLPALERAAETSEED